MTQDLTILLDYPFEANEILKKKKALKKALLLKDGMTEKKIAILGGSTTSEVRDILELFLLKKGIKPVFYESEFNRYYEDVMFDIEKLKTFAPDIVYIHTSLVNIGEFPGMADTEKEIDIKLSEEMQKFKAIWLKIKDELNCPVIQSNFELPAERVLGNLDFSDIHGRTNFISRLNDAFAKHAFQTPDFYINDINYLSAWFGLEKWSDKSYWYMYKIALCYEAIPLLAHNISNIIAAIFGKSKKCLVLDLDNTLWGGVVADEGLNDLKIGRETAVAEAFTAVQKYAKELKDRGIMLAVNSKNDMRSAEEGFSHPDSILSVKDFASFKANWDAKHENIKQIAKEINIGSDSMVFVDDNPAERDLVRSQLPEVEVPRLGDDVSEFVKIMDKAGYFEPAVILEEDFDRNKYYEDNNKRDEQKHKFSDYGEYLAYLKMKAGIGDFKPVYLDRITQLTNKTNQFNLTTKRYTLSEIEAVSKDANFIKIYGRLSDKFGDNGLVSVIIASIKRDAAHIDLWLMSCRVIKREMEAAMFDAFIKKCQDKEIKEIRGDYFPTQKNAMVADLFSQFGFDLISKEDNGASSWVFKVPEKYDRKNKHIEVSSD